jgi:hypothetical protein
MVPHNGGGVASGGSGLWSGVVVGRCVVVVGSVVLGWLSAGLFFRF